MERRVEERIEVLEGVEEEEAGGAEDSVEVVVDTPEVGEAEEIEEGIGEEEEAVEREMIVAEKGMIVVETEMIVVETGMIVVETGMIVAETGMIAVERGLIVVVKEENTGEIAGIETIGQEATVLEGKNNPH